MKGEIDRAAEAVREAAKDEGQKGAATFLIELAEAEGVQFFHSQLREPFGEIPINAHVEIHPVRSRIFKNFLCGTYFTRTKKAVSSEAVNAALNVFEAKAYFEGEERELNNRIAKTNDGFFIDLCTSDWTAVRVTAGGWELVEKPPLIFRRYAHMAPFPLPHRGGKVERLLDFVNVRDEDDRLLILVYVVAAFLPHIPRPVLVLNGPQGAAKSFFCRLLKSLIDPSHIPLISLPASVPELVQLLQHTYLACFDNVNELKDCQSDLLCRAVTGEGFTKRELYTDQEDIIFTFRRLIVINSINVAARKPDLLDRSLLISLERLTKKERRKEEDLLQEFEEARPSILGGIFDTLVRAFSIVGEVDLDELPRMADWCTWGEAVARALGYGSGVFYQAYMRNLKRQNIEAIEGSPVGIALLELVNHHSDGWEGSPSALYSALEKVAEELKVNTKSRGWPKAPNALTRKLKELFVNLREEGIEVEFGRAGDEKNTRTIRIVKIPSEASDRPKGPGKSSDDTSDDIKITQETVREPSDDSGPGVGRSDSSDDVLGTLKGYPLYPAKLPEPKLVRPVLKYVQEHKESTRTNVASGLAALCSPDAIYRTIEVMLDMDLLTEDPVTKLLACGQGRPA